MVETRRLAELGSTLAGLADFPDGPLMVALSGGPDSAGLAYLATRSGAQLRAVHVDHGTGHAGSLREAAMEICGVLGMGIETAALDLSGLEFSEERARIARYEALLGLRKPGEWVLTGHTRDDQAETVLMNLIRGAGPSGLAGIPPRSHRRMIARPLLAVPRSDLRELATLAGLPFVDDPSNEDSRFSRNAVRLSVIPLLESRFNPGFSASLARAAQSLRRDVDFLDSESSLLPVDLDDDRARIARSALTTAPRPLADRALRRMVAALRPPYGPTSDEMRLIWDVVGGVTGGAVLGGWLEVRLVGPFLVVRGSGIPGAEPTKADLSIGQHRLGEWVIEVVRHPGPARSIPLSLLSAVFPADTRLTASSDHAGRVTVEVGGEPAWIPGEKRFPVAFYQSGSNGYLSVFATEVAEWT